VGVAYDTDLNLALAIIQGILKSNPRVLQDPAPLIQVNTLAESAVSIGVRPWVSVLDYAAAIGELNQSMVETLRARGITIPFPQREIRLLGNTMPPREAG
jgi:small conductance mechanosensitive channel